MSNLYDLYTEKPGDKLVSLKDANGFTLVADYPGGREGVSVFLRLYVDDEETGAVGGSVNRVKSGESDLGGYSILDNEDPQGRVTNFSFDKEEGFKMVGGMVEHPRFKKSVTVDDFVTFLINNHTSDKLGFLRRRQYLFAKIVRIAFWLVDLNYKKSFKIFDFEGSSRNIETEFEKNEVVDPFLKYFYIPRNMLALTIIIFSFLTVFYYISFYFSPGWSRMISPPEVTNLLVVVYTAAIFVFLEFLSNAIKNSISSLDKKFETSLGKMIATISGFGMHKIKLDFNQLPKNYER